jgi:hypothetical protein
LDFLPDADRCTQKLHDPLVCLELNWFSLGTNLPDAAGDPLCGRSSAIGAALARPQPYRRPEEIEMSCPICGTLQRDYENKLGEYIAARTSAVYGLSKKTAAEKNVEMERARYELEEHQIVCAPAFRSLELIAVRGVSAKMTKLVA